MHARHSPRDHVFRYPVYQWLIDLDELPELDRRFRLFGWNRRAVTSWHDEDHIDIRAYLSDNGIDLSIVIPTYNAKVQAHDTANVLQSGLSAAGLQIEIILVDDGSRIDQRPEILNLPESARVILLDRNKGKWFAAATLAGTSWSRRSESTGICRGSARRRRRSATANQSRIENGFFFMGAKYLNDPAWKAQPFHPHVGVIADLCPHHDC